MSFTFDFDQDIPGLILHKAVEPNAGSQTVYKGAEAHPLHDALNGNGSSFHYDAPARLVYAGPF